MAVYDGFFDAAEIIGTHADGSPEYDREYNSTHFVKYFANTIGSGVCIHDNPDSFKVRFAGGEAVVSPGYLFIQGYWLRNDADYTIPLTGDATLAIAAHLNLGKRMIELEAVPMAQAYPDTLVLALVNPAAGTAEDTRYNTDICGVIDTAGELSKKVTWAINYIDNEIKNKLDAAEADIAEQSKLLDAKIAEVQAQVDKIAPPPIGSIKFSASQDVGPEWLRCNGDFVSESQYPELVAVLGKLTPSNDKFHLISDGEIGPQISNGVVYGGRLWVYSHSTGKLYGVDLEGTAAIKEISLSSENEHFNDFILPTTLNPIALSIVPHQSGNSAKIFIAQILSSGVIGGYKNEGDYKYLERFLIFESEFTGTEDSLTMTTPFVRLDNGLGTQIAYSNPKYCIPYVCGKTVDGAETYFCAVDLDNRNNDSPNAFVYLTWTAGAEASWYYNTVSVMIGNRYPGSETSSGKWNTINQRSAFTPKNLCELISVSDQDNSYAIHSGPSNTFQRDYVYDHSSPITTRESNLPITIAGNAKVLTCFNTNIFPTLSLLEDKKETIEAGIFLPSAARVFVDAAAYLWDKDIYMIFVGTGIIFSRTLEEGSFGYLDTTSVLGTITQFGYLDYSQDEGTLYIVGQDTTNKVKAAKIVLNTLYDYANDGAWLPMLSSDGVPAYIKAKEGT